MYFFFFNVFPKQLCSFKKNEFCICFYHFIFNSYTVKLIVFMNCGRNSCIIFQRVIWRC
jgi:hypothetical protein